MKEEFTSEIEAFSSHLVLENQQLQHENKQLNTLLKEYEQTLESVMGKFRGIAVCPALQVAGLVLTIQHASTQHDLSLHSYYTSLLQTLQTAHSSAHLHDNASLSLLLHRLSTLLRSALRALGGEDAEIDLETHIPGLLAISGSTGQSGDIHSDSAGSSPISPRSHVSFGPKSILRKGPQRPPVWQGSMPGASGGYIGTGGQGDWAMEREMEVLRLEEENASLREMLRIAQDSIEEVLEDSPEEPKSEEEAPPTAAEGQRRKSSLTLEELQLGAEQEDEEKRKRAKAEGLADVFVKTPEAELRLEFPLMDSKAKDKGMEKETKPKPALESSAR
jgi:hypothetical protein